MKRYKFLATVSLDGSFYERNQEYLLDEETVKAISPSAIQEVPEVVGNIEILEEKKTKDVTAEPTKPLKNYKKK